MTLSQHYFCFFHCLALKVTFVSGKHQTWGGHSSRLERVSHPHICFHWHVPKGSIIRMHAEPFISTSYPPKRALLQDLICLHSVSSNYCCWPSGSWSLIISTLWGNHLLPRNSYHTAFSKTQGWMTMRLAFSLVLYNAAERHTRTHAHTHHTPNGEFA